MTTDSSTEPRADDDDAIACRAYELYLARGCEDRCDVEDWLTAEAQLLQECAGADQAGRSPTPGQPRRTSKGPEKGPANKEIHYVVGR